MNVAMVATMDSANGRPAGDFAEITRIEKTLRLVTVPFPYLAGLVAATQLHLDERVPTMGVFASGRLVANPRFTAKLKDDELLFVLAHEMLHLALRTHDRARGSGQLEFNYAHDYIINDMLRAELGVATIPAGGLDMPGARQTSAEQIVVEMRQRSDRFKTRTDVWHGAAGSAASVMSKNATSRRGGGERQHPAGDVLQDSQEREMFPDAAVHQAERAGQIRQLAAKGLALAQAMGALKGLRGTDSGALSQMVTALRGMYRAPWEGALQRWLESVAPGERTFARASRRGLAQGDIVLPGRRREGWLLNIVLDTSGSMEPEIPRALGAIADFCAGFAVDQVRLLQCDSAVTADELLAPEDLAHKRMTGYGGSDLSPALRHLADDAQVRSAIVITDGDVEYPLEPMPYHVLWLIAGTAAPGFQPPYGKVVTIR